MALTDRNKCDILHCKSVNNRFNRIIKTCNIFDSCLLRFVISIIYKAILKLLYIYQHYCKLTCQVNINDIIRNFDTNSLDVNFVGTNVMGYLMLCLKI